MTKEERKNIMLPFDEWVETVIALAIAKHQQDCPGPAGVNRLNLRFAYTVGFMVGSGIVGGMIGSLVPRVLGG